MPQSFHIYRRREAGGVQAELSLAGGESAEIDVNHASQREVFEQPTHFSPVFMALAVLDDAGHPYAFNQFVDQGRSIVTGKSVMERDVRVLEHPGLWNGSMAFWNTIFVEVPEQVFTPVKSVLDLLRPDHQPLPPAPVVQRELGSPQSAATMSAVSG